MSTDITRSKLSLKRDMRADGGVEERLHKVLANAGLGSRRLLEERIEAGDVRVNGVVATLGSSVRSGDRVEMDGKAFVAVTVEPEEAQILIYHKPEGEVTTNDDPEGRPTVFERLPRLKNARWVSVGRLDINTTGLLLLTTDGELANALTHPSGELEREYVCRIHGNVEQDMLDRLQQGVELEDGPAKFDAIGIINLGENHSWLRVTLREGRNREVRRLWESQGVQVSRLKRIRYGNLELPRELRRGHWQVLSPEAYRAQRAQAGLAEAPQTLTLQSVIGVRRAAKSANEFRPAGKPRSSFDLHTSDEARELRAFDHVRDDRPAAKRPGKRRPGPGPGGPRRGRGQPGGQQPAWNDNSGGGFRTWSPGGNAGDSRRPAGGRPQRTARGSKPGQAAAPVSFPSDHAYAKRDEGNANRSPRGDNAGNRGPRRDDAGNRGPRRDDVGNRGPRGDGPGARGPRSDSPGGRRGPAGNGPSNRGPRGNGPGAAGGPRRNDGGDRKPGGPGRGRPRG